MIMQLLLDGARRLGLSLDADQISKFQAYYEELIDWNIRLNLTAITDYEDVQLKHFLDSLTVASALPEVIPPGVRVIDVGSGGGFPGLPLKIAFPQIELVLLEATAKKAGFLNHMIQRLSLENTAVVCSRSETAAHLPEYRESFDAVVTRGLAEMPVLAELTLPFCRVGGRLIAQKKGDIAEEIGSAAKAVSALGGGFPIIQKINIPEFSDGRCLVIIEKKEMTPPNFPRRDGMPAKRPLI
jgi:16S rRNA (guanine527-N7)-methyltransferase